jgi:acetoin utilization deacetylase AcuC-like enzyme
MHIIFHDAFCKYYDDDPAAEPGRMEAIMEELRAHDGYVFHSPEKATEEQILRVHSLRHYQSIRNWKVLFELASLAAGGAIEAAKLGYRGEPAFAVIRPPGHHASPDSCWGFCHYNNMAIALLELFERYGIDSAYLLDFDLHTGDGNIHCLQEFPNVHIFNPNAMKESDYLDRVKEDLDAHPGAAIIAASAGFDYGINDWGHLLTADAYFRLGQLMKEYAEKNCKGRRFAILEGGYYQPDLGKQVHAFCQGFQ